jgi:hypothetical protein
MNFSVFVNSAGLALDIVGAILIWNFGLPTEIDGARRSVTPREGDSEVKRLRTADFYARLGGFLLIGGFALQLISNFIH